MRALIGSIVKNRRLLKDFVARDLKARYVGSSMGFFWSVVFPIINLFVFMFVFRLVLKARWSDHQGPLEVALVMLAGIVVWAAFAETISRSTNALVENANLIQKVVFPSELLPVYLTISSLINMCIGLPVVLLCVAYFVYLAPPGVMQSAPSQVVEEQFGAMPIRVGLERGLAWDVEVPFTVAGTATEGEDYSIVSSPIRIPSGHLAGDILVTPIDDGVIEGDETVVVTLGEPEGAGTTSLREHVMTLRDGPPPPERQRPRAIPVDDEYHPLRLGMHLVALPILFLLQVMFTSGIGFFLATFNVFLRDTFHLVGVFTTVWMFSTPIFYPAQMVQNAGYGWILELNPMYWLIDSYRAVLLYASWPDWMLLARFLVISLVVLFLGSSFFMAQKHRFPDLL